MPFKEEKESEEVTIWRMAFRLAAIVVVSSFLYVAHSNYVDYLTTEAGIAKGFSPIEARCGTATMRATADAGICLITASKK